MNVFDYLFEHTYDLEKDLVKGPKEFRSYRIIVQESIQVANYLRSTLGKGHRIPIVAANSCFFVIAFFGILKSGNICVPLNPSIEPDNLKYILDKIDAKIGFFSDTLKNRLRPSVVCLTESNIGEILGLEEQVFKGEKDFDGNRVAEILFTSGSTAQPKGVMITHNNIIANTESILKYLELTDKDVMLVVLPFYYCYGLSLLFTHIRVGGSLVLNNEFIFLGNTVNNLIKFGCTGFAGVPSHFQILLRKSELFKNSMFPALRYVTQAGGKLHNTFIQEFIHHFPGIKFYVMYGQTEATARLSYLHPAMLEKKLGSLGKGIPGVELKVVDQHGNKVPPGIVGEIWARGDNVMLGYFEDPIATQLAIQDCWLHTGDLAVIDEDGYIYLTARKKEIIKVGGNRVSPKEIEEVIVIMAGIIDCTVEAMDDEVLGESIKATVVINEKGKQLNEEDIRQFCSSRLANYKVPSTIIFRDHMDVSPSGKKLYRANK